MIIAEMWNDGRIGRVLLMTCIAVVVLVPIAIWGSVVEQRQWNEYAIHHHCRLVARMTGDMLVSPIISSNGGVAITTTSEKAAYACDDGVTYWRGR